MASDTANRIHRDITAAFQVRMTFSFRLSLCLCSVAGQSIDRRTVATSIVRIKEAVGTNHLALLHVFGTPLHVLELHWSSIGTPEMALPYPRPRKHPEAGPMGGPHGFHRV